MLDLSSKNNYSKLIFLGTLFLLVSLTTTGFAQKAKPIQVSIINPLQLFNEDQSIKGVRFNLLYGKNKRVTGLDVGLVNHTGSGGFKGLQYGFVNLNNGESKGFQLGGINFNKSKTTGLLWGAVNTAPDMKGFQYGFVNNAGTMNGFQLGLVNYAQRMTKGLQIGVINIIREGGKFPVFPIVNWSF